MGIFKKNFIPPLGISHYSGYVCKLKKTLYCLKQAPRAWFEKFSIVISSFSFVSSNHDSAIFIKCTDESRIIFSLYVNDMIITGDDIDGISVLKTELARRFEMKDLSYFLYFLGIEVAYSPKGYLFSQLKYVADILERARFTVNKTVDTPIEVNTKYSSSSDIPLTDPTLYRTIIGSLIYLTITCLDIAYVVHVVSQFVYSLTTVYWTFVLHILLYLRGTVFQSLLLPSFLELRVYSNVDYGSDTTDHKFATSFCIFLSDSLISWKSKRQSTVS